MGRRREDTEIYQKPESFHLIGNSETSTVPFLPTQDRANMSTLSIEQNQYIVF